MDHKPLVSLFSLTRPILDSLPPRIIRWSLLMSSYDYSIINKPGTNIVAADAMSHLPQPENLQILMPGCIIHLMDHLDDTTESSPFKGLPSCTIRNKSTGGAPLFSISYKEI